jgi:dipeptidyl aminopeptidase/acylaminoacyl peptidase
MEAPRLVLPVPIRPSEQHSAVDLYLPDDLSRPRPGVLLIHGGPRPAGNGPQPRETPMFQQYASLLAERGVVAAMFDHRLHTPADYPQAEDDVRTAVDILRADPRVDPGRIVLWFFSGGGLLSAAWLAEPPAWLRGMALTYPVLDSPEGWNVDVRYRPAEAVTNAPGLPLLLTRVGKEFPQFAWTIEPFVEVASKGNLEIIDVPGGRHSFDILDDTDESRTAIVRAADWVASTA